MVIFFVDLMFFGLGVSLFASEPPTRSKEVGVLADFWMQKTTVPILASICRPTTLKELSTLLGMLMCAVSSFDSCWTSVLKKKLADRFVIFFLAVLFFLLLVCFFLRWHHGAVGDGKVTFTVSLVWSIWGTSPKQSFGNVDQ